MAVVVLVFITSSPWTIPADFKQAGHTVTLFGNGGNGGLGTTGTSGTSGGGGGGGACTALSGSSGTMTPGSTIPFLINNGGSANATQWQSSTAGTGNFYEALPGGNGAAAGTAGAASGATNTVGTPTITYTATTHTGGAGGAGGGANTLGAGGGGGGGGTGANGGAGGTPTSTGGGGGGGGGAANAGGSPSTATGGTGGAGATGTGGTGSGTSGTAGQNGTGSSGAGGGPGAAASSTGGVGGSGAEIENNLAPAGLSGFGGGGGGSGRQTATGAPTANVGGNNGNWAGGGGGAAASRTAGGTLTAGGGGPGSINIFYTSTAWGFDTQQDSNTAVILTATPGLGKRLRGAGLRQRSEFGYFPNLTPLGFPQTSSQEPARPYRKMAAATMRGDDGIAAPYVYVAPPTYPAWGFDVQTEQLKVRAVNKSGIRHKSEFGGYANPPPFGWDQVYSQSPPRPYAKQAAAFMRGLDGIDAPLSAPPPPSMTGWIDAPMLGARQQRKTFAALRHRSEFAYYSPMPPMGWEQARSQEPARPYRRAAATMRGHDGIDSPFVPPPVAPWGYLVQEFQPPHRRIERAGVMFGAANVEAPVTVMQPWFELTSALTKQRPRVGGALPSAFNVDAPLAFVVQPWQWEPNVPQPPQPRWKRAAAIMLGEGGIEAAFIAALPTAWPFVTLPELVRPRVSRAGLAQRTQFASFPPWVNFGFDPMPFQPPHRFYRNLDNGDGGIEQPFGVVPAKPWGWDNAYTSEQLRVPARFRGGAIRSRTEFAYFPATVPYVDPVYPQPPARPYRRAAAIMIGEPGIEAALTVPAVLTAWPFVTLPELRPLRKAMAALKGKSEFGIPGPPPLGAWFEFNQAAQRWPQWFRGAGIEGRSEFAFSNLLPMGWETPWLPMRLTRSRAAAIFAGDQGNQAAFVAPPVPLTAWQTTTVPDLPSRPRKVLSALRHRSEFAFYSPMVPLIETPQFQPPHPRPERGGAIMVGDPGNQNVFTFVAPTVVPWMFEQNPFQPPHPRRERAGAIQDHSVYPLAALAFIVSPWAYQPQDFQPPQPRWKRAGAFAQPLNIETALVNLLSFGFENQAWQPPHPRREKAGALMPWFDVPTPLAFVVQPWGYQPQDFQPPQPRWMRPGAIQESSVYPLTSLALPPPPPWAFEQNPFQPPQPRWKRAGALIRPFDVETGLVNLLQFGFENQAWQPPHPRREKAGAIMPWFDVPAPLQFIVPPFWQIADFQPPHPRPERAGALFGGDPGIEATLPPPRVQGWEAFYPQPPHRRTERAGVLFGGDTGTQARPVLVYVPMGWEPNLPVPLRQYPTARARAGAIMRGDEGNLAPYVFRLPVKVAKSYSLITGWGAESDLGVLELQLIISAFGGDTDVERDP